MWWTQGNQSQQLLRDGEIDMMAMWNARGSELKQQGAPVEVVWEGATIHTTTWGVVKGARNAKAAWEFIQFAVQPERQADFAARLFYGPSNPAAYKHLSAEVARQLPTYPENQKQTVTADAEWEATNARGCRSASRSGSPPESRRVGRTRLAPEGVTLVESPRRSRFPKRMAE